MIARKKSVNQVPTAAEFRLLELLWPLGSGTVDDILVAGGKKSRLNYKTVQTLLRIMEKKGFITHRIRGRAFVFQPSIQPEQVSKISVRSFVDRYFRGSRFNLLINLLDEENVPSDELDRLEDLIRQRRKSRRRG